MSSHSPPHKPFVFSGENTFFKMRHSVKNCPCKTDTRARTETFLPQLKTLARSNIIRRTKSLQNANDCFIKYIADSAGAVLRTDIQLPPEKYSQLKKHKDTLLFLAKKRPSIKEKREKLIQQKGGFLNILLPALVSGLAGFVGRAIGGSTF